MTASAPRTLSRWTSPAVAMMGVVGPMFVGGRFGLIAVDSLFVNRDTIAPALFAILLGVPAGMVIGFLIGLLVLSIGTSTLEQLGVNRLATNVALALIMGGSSLASWPHVDQWAAQIARLKLDSTINATRSETGTTRSAPASHTANCSDSERPVPGSPQRKSWELECR